MWCFFCYLSTKTLHTFNSQNQVTLLILQPDTHSDRDVSPTMGKVVKVDIAPDRRPSAYSNQVTAKTGQTGQTGTNTSKHNYVMDIHTCISTVKRSHGGRKCSREGHELFYTIMLWFVNAEFDFKSQWKVHHIVNISCKKLFSYCGG